MRLLLYTGLRFALFLVAFLLLWVLLGDELSSWVLALAALLISSVASFILLRGQAEQAGTEFAGRWRLARNRLDEAKRREDDEFVDELGDQRNDNDAHGDQLTEPEQVNSAAVDSEAGEPGLADGPDVETDHRR